MWNAKYPVIGLSFFEPAHAALCDLAIYASCRIRIERAVILSIEWRALRSFADA
jgi:hypothetical protein